MVRALILLSSSFSALTITTLEYTHIAMESNWFWWAATSSYQEGSRVRLLFFRGDCYFEVLYPHIQIEDDVTFLGDPELLETAQQNLSEFFQALAVQAEVFISSDKGEINRNLINFRWHGVLQLNFQHLFPSLTTNLDSE